MLSDDIIAEIQEQCSRDSDEELDMIFPIKSCLKKPPTVSKAIDKKKKSGHSKRKRNRYSGKETFHYTFIIRKS